MSETTWVVTTRNRVHLRDSECADRIAFPRPWTPAVTGPRDHACPTCLDGILPTTRREDHP